MLLLLGSRGKKEKLQNGSKFNHIWGRIKFIWVPKKAG